MLNDYLSELAILLFNKESSQINEPNAWLSDIAEITMGQSPQGSSYNENGIGEVFYQGRAEFGSFFPRRRLFTTEPKRMAREGDTLMSVRAPVGDLNVASEACCIGRGLAAIHSDNNQSFVHYLVRAQKRRLDSFNGDGTVFGSINGKALKELPVWLPSDDVINHLQCLLEPIDTMIRKNDDEIQVLEALRDSLLPKLMSGEIDVSKIEITQLNNHLSDFMDTLIKLRERMSMNAQTKDQILSRMQPALTGMQLKLLKEVLTEAFCKEGEFRSRIDYLDGFLKAKEVEGCSPKTIAYYQATIEHMNSVVNKEPTAITTDDLRNYLRNYETTRHSSKVTIDNIRRILSSYFSWLEDEDYIVKSPVRRIRHVRAPKPVKETFTDEQLELVRNSCEIKRDLAIVDLLTSTGMRIGELVRLNITDIDFIERECIVTGKGNKQRPVYFDARTKLHLMQYLETRNDSNQALFVSLNSTSSRLSIGAVELRLRKLGRKAGVKRVHPHKFRRTLATHAIEKGMPIEQVQKLLGHAKIDTTMHYAMVNQSNVKASHRRYLE